MSNLLQKASIVTTPTAYGVGVLNSIKPALVTFNSVTSFANGTTYPFTTFTSSGNNVTSGIVSSAFGGCVSNAIALKKNQKVKVTFDYTQNSGNELRVLFSKVVTGAGSLISDSTTINSTGTFDHTFTITEDTTGYLQLGTGNSGHSINFSALNVTAEVLSLADFDFTRNSSATRVNPDYLIQDVSILSSNLVQNGNFSELSSELVVNGNFATDSDWNKTQATISNGVANISSDGSYAAIDQSNVSVIGKTYLYSIDVKSITGTMQFRLGSGTDVDITTIGIKTGYIVANSTTLEIKRKSGAGEINATIDNVSVKQVDPNDYWTISSGAAIGLNKLNINADAFNFFAEQTVLTNGLNYKVTLDAIVTSGDILIYTGTQFATINSSGTYTFNFISNSTKIRFRSSGSALIGSITNISVIEVQQTDIPRLDYTNGTASILLEGQSTNLITYSQDFSNSYWTKSGASVTSGFVSPDGTNNAYKLVEDSANSRHFINSAEFLTPGTVYSSSVFVKPNGRNKIAFRENAQTGNYAAFNLSNGTLIGTNGVSASIESMSNGWYRINYQITSGASIVLGFELLSDSYTSGDPFSNPYQGNGTSGIYIYGAQVEQQSYATSYIPTSGSTITRAAETLNNAGNSDLINSTEGVLYAEIKGFVNDALSRPISISDGTTSNRINLFFPASQTQVVGRVNSGGVTVADMLYTGINQSLFNKIAVKYKENDFALWINGIEVLTDTSGAAPVGLKELAFDNAAATKFQGRCKTVAVFKEALSDTELACLTSTNNREIFLNYYYRMQYVGANTEAIDCAQIKLNV